MGKKTITVTMTWTCEHDVEVDDNATPEQVADAVNHAIDTWQWTPHWDCVGAYDNDTHEEVDL